ncbi:hypothetical protein TSAR_001573, partial [Trichomalopsis sarcophagae]
MCITRIKVLKESFNLRTGKLRIITCVKSCLGLKIAKNHKNLNFLRKSCLGKKKYFVIAGTQGFSGSRWPKEPKKVGLE